MQLTCKSRRAGVLTAECSPRRASHTSRLPRPTVAGVAGGSKPSRLRVHGPARNGLVNEEVLGLMRVV